MPAAVICEGENPMHVAKFSIFYQTHKDTLRLANAIHKYQKPMCMAASQPTYASSGCIIEQQKISSRPCSLRGCHTPSITGPRLTQMGATNMTANVIRYFTLGQTTFTYGNLVLNAPCAASDRLWKWQDAGGPRLAGKFTCVLPSRKCNWGDSWYLHQITLPAINDDH